MSRKEQHSNGILKFLYSKDYKCILNSRFQEAAKEKAAFNNKAGNGKVTSSDFTMRILASATSLNKASMIESEFINKNLLNDKCLNVQSQSNYLKQINGRFYGSNS